MPYDDAYQNLGTGFHSDGLLLRANPFNITGSEELTNESVVTIGEVIKEVSMTTYEHSRALKKTANMEFHGWDFRAQAKFANRGQVSDYLPN
jgi:hypothetical protein